jgi:hypothetical protein
MAIPKQSSKKTISPKSRPLFDRLSSRKQDIACIVILYVLVLLLFGKIVFNNMAFSESPDATSHEAFLKAIQTIQEKEGVEPLWLPYIFSGMPAFAGLLFPRDVNFVEKVSFYTGKLLFFNSDLSWFPMHYFMMGLFMYLLARQMQFGQLPSLLAAVTLMLNPFAIGLAQSGHGSKLITLSYVPLLFLLTHRLFKKRDVLSFGLLAVVTGTLFLSRHPQIAFYGLLTIGSYLLYEIILDIKTQQSKVVLKKFVLFVLALAIGFAIYSYEFLPTDQYSKYSIRGGSETGVSKGLDYNYATNWSFHPFETITYVIPSFFGFSSQYVTEWQGQEGALPLYWGWMPFTDGPVYIGIIPLLLGIIALIYNRNRLAWFLGIFSLLILMLSFGKYFSVIYDLFFNYFPYFNKFRVPVLILYLMPMTFGLLAANGCTFLADLYSRNKDGDAQKMKKRLMVFGGIIAASLLIGFIGHDSIKSALSGSMFVKADDHLQYNQQVIEALKTLRYDVLWNYYIGFAVMVILFVGLIIAYINRKIASSTMVFGFIVVLVVDLYLIDTKFINPQPPAPPHQETQSDPTIQAIKAESDTAVFRVLPIANFDGGNMMMYHHIQSVEGYSPAKLKIYQDMRDSCFARSNINVYNMLNVKYIIGQQKAQDGSVQTVAQINPTMLPRAWFVDTTVVSASKAEIFARLNSPAWNPKTTAILEQALPTKVSKSDSASVAVTTYRSREIVLKTVSSATSLLVVSEVYYPAGWDAYIDGNKTEIYKTNYILRSVIVPAGMHTIEFKFDPPMYQLGYTLSRIGWGIALLVILVGLFQQPSIRQRLGLGKKQDAPPADTAAIAPS